MTYKFPPPNPADHKEITVMDGGSVRLIHCDDDGPYFVRPGATATRPIVDLYRDPRGWWKFARRPLAAWPPPDAADVRVTELCLYNVTHPMIAGDFHTESLATALDIACEDIRMKGR